MLHYLDRLINRLSHYVTQMEMTECLIMALSVIVIGFLCLRGFGSRKHY